jgi:hypothetical protein
MKLFALLPLVLLSASCFYPAPPPRQRPPQYGPSGPDSPYYGPSRPQPGTETGTFEPVPDGNRPPPPDTRPRISDDPVIPDDAPTPAPTPRQDYPTAKPSSRPGHVISPYAPYNVIDAAHIKSGALAKDPSNGKIFRVP